VVPAGAVEELVAGVDADASHHVVGPVTMRGGLGNAVHDWRDGDVLDPSAPPGTYGVQQLDLLYPGLPPRLARAVNVGHDAGALRDVTDAIASSVALQAAVEGGGGEGGAGAAAAVRAALDALAADPGARLSLPEWAPRVHNATGLPATLAGGRAHAAWAPPRFTPINVTGLALGDRLLLGVFLCLGKAGAARERAGGDMVTEGYVNLRQEVDLVESGWTMVAATRAFVWHEKAATLPAARGVDRNDKMVCHARRAGVTPAPPPTTATAGGGAA
jgi:hypothetical protein